MKKSKKRILKKIVSVSLSLLNVLPFAIGKSSAVTPEEMQNEELQNMQQEEKFIREREKRKNAANTIAVAWKRFKLEEDAYLTIAKLLRRLEKGCVLSKNWFDGKSEEELTLVLSGKSPHNFADMVYGLVTLSEPLTPPKYIDIFVPDGNYMFGSTGVYAQVPPTQVELSPKVQPPEERRILFILLFNKNKKIRESALQALSKLSSKSMDKIILSIDRADKESFSWGESVFLDKIISAYSKEELRDDKDELFKIMRRMNDREPLNFFVFPFTSKYDFFYGGNCLNSVTYFFGTFRENYPLKELVLPETMRTIDTHCTSPKTKFDLLCSIIGRCCEKCIESPEAMDILIEIMKEDKEYIFNYCCLGAGNAEMYAGRGMLCDNDEDRIIMGAFPWVIEWAEDFRHKNIHDEDLAKRYAVIVSELDELFEISGITNSAEINRAEHADRFE